MEHLWHTAGVPLHGQPFSYAAHWPWLGGLGLLVVVQATLIIVLLWRRARRSEQALRQMQVSLDHAQSLLKFPAEIPNAVLRIESNGVILYANDASAPLLAMWCCQPGQRVPEDWRTRMVAALDSGQGQEVEVTCGDRVFSYILTPVVDAGYVNVYGRDISARKRAELELRRINRALSALRTCSQILIRATDETALLRRTCQAIVEVAGYRLAWVGLAEHDEHKTVRPVAQAGFDDAYLETVDITWADTERGRGPTGTAIRTGTPVVARDLTRDPSFLPWRAEAVRRGYASSIALPLASNGEVVGALSVYAVEPNAFDAREVELLQELADDLAYGISAQRTLAERRRAEEEKAQLQAQLYRAKKMEAIGQLAGGLAHDFNNILTAVMGNVEMLRGLRAPETAADDPWLVQLDQIERASQHAAALTRQMLAFSRRQPVQQEVLDLNRILGDMETMLGRLIGAHITLTFVLAPQLATIRADGGQLEQVVMNLAVNASDAMPNGGTVMIGTDDVLLDDAHVTAHQEARPGPHVLLTVSDTGCGMSKEVLDRIFEPFFTTKPVGQGTGLGLATVYGIVKQFDGHIAVDSEPGRGSTFKVYLPAAVERAEVRMPWRDGEPRGGTETILVCEDDDTVRAITVQFLQATGYTVLAAANGHEALELAAEHRDPLHLLLTDVVMPGINGKQLATALCVIRPELKTLYISGYTADVIAHHGVLDPGVELLPKPFSRRALLERVHLILGTPSRQQRTRGPCEVVPGDGQSG